MGTLMAVCLAFGFQEPKIRKAEDGRFCVS